MKVKFSAILSVGEALKAVAHNGEALQYVHDLDLFTRIAAKLSIEIEL